MNLKIFLNRFLLIIRKKILFILLICFTNKCKYIKIFNLFIKLLERTGAHQKTKRPTYGFSKEVHSFMENETANRLMLKSIYLRTHSMFPVADYYIIFLLHPAAYILTISLSDWL
jgi:hypothetical protein